MTATVDKNQQESNGQQNLETLLASIWGRREAGIKLPFDVSLTRAITPQDIEYLSNHTYPFLQIIDSQAEFNEEVNPVFTKLDNGWVVFDYGDALCSSYTTKHFFAKHALATTPYVDNRAIAGDVSLTAASADNKTGGGGDDDEGEAGGDGTIINQQFDAVFAMIAMAKVHGWRVIEVVDGSAAMQFYAWVIAQEMGVDIIGFSPSDEEMRHYKRLAKDKLVARKEQEFQAKKRIARVVPTPEIE